MTPLEAALADYRDLAADWHGGQWSALYSLASAGRCTDPERLAAEVRDARRDAACQDPQFPDDVLRFDAMLAVLAEHATPEPE